jgi:hypothetical protein
MVNVHMFYKVLSFGTFGGEGFFRSAQNRRLSLKDRSAPLFGCARS